MGIKLYEIVIICNYYANNRYVSLTPGQGISPFKLPWHVLIVLVICYSKMEFQYN